MIDYGFNSTDEVELDAQGLPVGIAKFMAIGEESSKNDDGVVVEWECLDGANKGRKGKVWYMTRHSNPTTANIAKQAIKRIADATGKAVTATSPIKGRVLTLDVRKQKKDPRYTEVARYLPEDYKPEVQPPF